MSNQPNSTGAAIGPSQDTVSPAVLKQFPHLFARLNIGPIIIKNRVFVSAHTTVLAENGGLGEGLIAFLEAKARGGPGLIFTEAVNAHPSGSESDHELCGWRPAFAEGLRTLRSRFDAYGTRLFAQLFHSGGGGTHAGMMEARPNVQPSNLPFVCEGLVGTSHALTREEIEQIIEGFASTAQVCEDNGAHGAEVAAAHGYLIHRFLSPLHNHRTDRYGGDFDRRLNFLRDILCAIRRKVSRQFPVGVRINCDDFLPESLSNDDYLEICRRLEKETLVDFIDLTGSHEFIGRSLIHHYGTMDDKAGHMISRVAKIHSAVSVPVIHAGRIINPRQAEDLLAAGHLDMVGMTRASIADPDFLRKTAEQREEDIIYCVGCAQACMGRVNHGQHVTCIQNPFTGREHVWRDRSAAGQRKRIVVVGGGPAGMSCAHVAASRGHEVVLYDDHHELGGQVLLAEQMPLCLEMGSVARNLSRQVRQAGVTVHLNTRATSEMVLAQEPDDVVLATGSESYLPQEVKGISQEHVFTLERAFCRPDLLGTGVLLVDNDGHQRGASTAAWLVKIGKKLRVATEFSHPGCNFEMSLLKNRMYQIFYRNSVPVYPNYRLVEIGRRSALLKDNYADTDLELTGIDSIVVLYPRKAHTPLQDDLESSGRKIHLIGDCLSPRNIEYGCFVGAPGKEHLTMQELRTNMGKASPELDRCMSCGLCLSDCPTYNITGRVSSSPRGRIRLMKSLSEGTIQLDDKVPYTDVTVHDELNSCLGCLACDTSCPADIRYSEMLDGLKKTLFDTDPRYKEQLGMFLKEIPVDQPEKLRSLTRLLAIAKASGAIWILRNTPLKYLLPATRRNMLRLLAKRIPFRASSQQLFATAGSAGGNGAAAGAKLRVGVFLGCINDQMFAEVNLAVVRVLRRLGAEVIVPESETCCGAIHHHMGERETSRTMAIRNCERFLHSKVDVIAASAAGCGCFMKSYARSFPGEAVLQEIAPKFRDIHEVIWQLLQMDPSAAGQWVWPRQGERATYHEACHLVHGQGVSEVPRKLLQSIQGLEMVPLQEATMCCGSAGTYNLFHPGMAAQIQARKIKAILDTQATVVAVANSGCALQIMSGLRDAGKRRIRCLHPVEMIDMSWR